MDVKTVLLMDDNRSFNKVFSVILRASKDDLQILEGNDPSEVLDLIEKIDTLDLAILDYNFSRTLSTGVDIAVELRAKYPTCFTVLTSAYLRLPCDVDLLIKEGTITCFMSKPLTSRTFKILYEQVAGA